MDFFTSPPVQRAPNRWLHRSARCPHSTPQHYAPLVSMLRSENLKSFTRCYFLEFMDIIGPIFWGCWTRYLSTYGSHAHQLWLHPFDILLLALFLCHCLGTFLSLVFSALRTSCLYHCTFPFRVIYIYFTQKKEYWAITSAYSYRQRAALIKGSLKQRGT